MVFAAHSLMKKFMVFMGPAFLAIMVATCGESGQGKSGGEGSAEERPAVPVVERTVTKKEGDPADAAGRGEEQNRNEQAERTVTKKEDDPAVAAGRGEEQNRNEQASGNNNDGGGGGGGGGQANGGGGGPAGDRAGAGVVVPAPGAYATLETSPVPHVRDAADDAAIWRDATDPARSTVIGTDKRGGVAV